jgi:hypothetical protein
VIIEPGMAEVAERTEVARRAVRTETAERID